MKKNDALTDGKRLSFARVAVRHLGHCAVLSVLLLALASPARAEEEAVRVYLQWLPQSQFAGFIMAQEKDLFRKHGLPSVELKWADLGQFPFQAMVDGEAEYATGWLLSALQLRAEGRLLINIAQFHQRSGSMLLARKDHGINNLKALKDKVLLSWGGDFAAEFQLFLTAHRVTPRAVLPLSSSLAPFLNGLVSAMQAMEYNEYYRVLERGMRADELMIFRLSDFGFNFAGDGLYTTEQRLTTHRDEAAALRKAVLEGWEYAFAHEDETIATVLRYGDAMHVNSNASHQRHMLRTIRVLMEQETHPERWGRLDKQDFEDVSKLLTRQGYFLGGLPFNAFHILP